ncbi:MAG: response regulator [Proteobacteria bacterium]|nr:response regulator [Pseudomonadota bacterium]
MPRILVIDDDELWRHYLTALLERCGVEVRSLPNGSNVAKIIQTEHFDAVVTDLYMPDVDGIETIANVKRQAPTMPIIGITGDSLGPMDPMLRAMTALGADAVLAKPLDGVMFLAALWDVLARARLAGSGGGCGSPSPQDSSLQ